MNVEGVSPQELQALSTALNYVAKTPLERLGQIIDARMSYWHFSNLLATAEKTQRLLEAKGLNPEQLDPKFREIVPILESAKNEDDEVLQDMWAGLLASSVQADSLQSPLKDHEILKQISPLEAQVLLARYQSGDDFVQAFDWRAQMRLISEKLGAEYGDILIAVDDLHRLGLVRLPGEDHSLEKRAFVSGPLQLTRIAESFMARCTCSTPTYTDGSLGVPFVSGLKQDD